MSDLPPVIIEECKRRALGLVLSDWGDLTYEQVIESLEEDGQNYPSNKKIIVWQPHEDKWADFILEEIESNYAMLIRFAEDIQARMWGKEN